MTISLVDFLSKGPFEKKKNSLSTRRNIFFPTQNCNLNVQSIRPVPKQPPEVSTTEPRSSSRAFSCSKFLKWKAFWGEEATFRSIHCDLSHTNVFIGTLSS